MAQFKAGDLVKVTDYQHARLLHSSVVDSNPTGVHLITEIRGGDAYLEHGNWFDFQFLRLVPQIRRKNNA